MSDSDDNDTAPQHLLDWLREQPPLPDEAERESRGAAVSKAMGDFAYMNFMVCSDGVWCTTNLNPEALAVLLINTLIEGGHSDLMMNALVRGMLIDKLTEGETKH